MVKDHESMLPTINGNSRPCVPRRFFFNFHFCSILLLLTHRLVIDAQLGYEGVISEATGALLAMARFTSGCTGINREHAGPVPLIHRAKTGN